MGSFSSIPPDPRDQREATPMADPRLQPTMDCGTLGPDSDVGGDAARGQGASYSRLRLAGPVLAVCAGVILAVLVGISHSAGAGRSHNVSQDPSTVASGENAAQLDRLKPQKQAETLLELAVGRSDVALDQISSRVDRWQGKLKWNPQIATLTTAALNSNDTRVRESGIEVELAAYGLSKNSASLDYLLKTAESSDHSRKIWALWALGLMGNRGVGTPRVIQVLTTHLKDSDADSRRWAVEGLALIGATETISPLLQVMHNDPVPAVREAAACALAESGMFTLEQRLAMVPQLLTYTDDPSLDAQTHAWAFQALGDITHQHLPNDSAAWRSWYDSARNN
jgi:HEAT repeats